MFDWHVMNNRLQGLTLKVFKSICTRHDIRIGDGDLKIILRILKDNPYSVINEEYAPILLLEIKRETSHQVCEDFRPIIEEKYLIQEME